MIKLRTMRLFYFWISSSAQSPGNSINSKMLRARLRRHKVISIRNGTPIGHSWNPPEKKKNN